MIARSSNSAQPVPVLRAWHTSTYLLLVVGTAANIVSLWGKLRYGAVDWPKMTVL